MTSSTPASELEPRIDVFGQGDTTSRPSWGQRGQSTVEYALLLLGAAAIAMLVVAWVARTDMIGKLFEIVLGRIVDQT